MITKSSPLRPSEPVVVEGAPKLRLVGRDLSSTMIMRYDFDGSLEDWYPKDYSYGRRRTTDGGRG